MASCLTPLTALYFLSVFIAYLLGKNFPDASCFLNSKLDNRPIRMKKVEELTDDEIRRVRAQQEPCHFGNCTHKEYQRIEWPDVDDKHPLIWVGGMPRSGTTLMRAILDVHPDVRCGEETRVIPRVLMARKAMKSEKNIKDLFLGKVDVNKDESAKIDNGIKRFILEIIEKHGPIARRLCNKDPFALKYMKDLSEWYPNSKFIYMIRDGRSVAHSIITRKVTITGYDLTSYPDVIGKWNQANTLMWEQCKSLGPSYCLPVHYEHLVLEKEKVLRQIAQFLNLEWNDALAHHEEHIGSDISLSNLERSTDQVVKPMYKTALSSWEGIIETEDLDKVEEVAPLMKVFGYKPEIHRGEYDQFKSENQSDEFKKTFPFRI